MDGVGSMTGKPVELYMRHNQRKSALQATLSLAQNLFL